MLDVITRAVSLGAILYPNISGGKDGQAMTQTLARHGFAMQGLIHCDLGRIEWPESIVMCRRQAGEFGLPLHIVRRRDGRGMIEHWKHRMNQLQGTGKPFWSSSAARYCTSDMKRDPTDVFYRGCGHDLIISCEGIRSDESRDRSKKNPLTVRTRCSHAMYHGMSASEALYNFVAGRRLALTWYPIFNFSLEEVLSTYGNTIIQLHQARKYYKSTGIVPGYWKFHPAYAYGNDRVSCMFCVLGCVGDLSNAKLHAPNIHSELTDMEDESGFTFRNGFSLKSL